MTDPKTHVADPLQFVPRVLPVSDFGELPAGFYPLRLVLPALGRVLELTRPEMIAGRHSEADIHLAHPEVSRRHCRFVFHDGAWEIEDLDSLNGVFVNDENVTRRILRPGDIVRIGAFTLVVQLASENDADGAAVLRRIANAIPAERRKAS
jgi:pSer/pThr/pTyr-binding forkhead associated (FHA) protein